MCSDVLVPVGSCAAVAPRVIVSDAPDDQIAADQQRILLIPAERETLPYTYSCVLSLMCSLEDIFKNFQKIKTNTKKSSIYLFSASQ